MSASHDFDMTPICGKAYGSDGQWVNNQLVHDWEKSHFMWDGPMEGNPSEKGLGWGGNAPGNIDMTPGPTVDWVNKSTFLMFPLGGTEDSNRKGKIAEITKLTWQLLVTLPNEPGVNTALDLYEIPDMGILRAQLYLATVPITIGTTDLTQLIYPDATWDQAVWAPNEGSYTEGISFRKLYDNKVTLRRSGGRMESCDGIPESGSASITSATYSYGGDMKALRWGMRDMSLLQKYSNVSSTATGTTVWNLLIVKLAAKYMCRKAVKKGFQVLMSHKFAFLDRLGVNPKPGLYINRFGQVEAAKGPRTMALGTSMMEGSLRSRKKTRPIWDESCDDDEE